MSFLLTPGSCETCTGCFCSLQTAVQSQSSINQSSTQWIIRPIQISNRYRDFNIRYLCSCFVLFTQKIKFALSELFVIENILTIHPFSQGPAASPTFSSSIAFSFETNSPLALTLTGTALLSKGADTQQATEWSLSRYSSFNLCRLGTGVVPVNTNTARQSCSLTKRSCSICN